MGGGGITAKNSSIPAENSSYPAYFDKICQNSQNLKNAQNVQNECNFFINKNKSENTINGARVARKNCGENYSERKIAKCNKNLDNCGLNNKNQIPFKNSYKNVKYSNNASYKNNIKAYSATTKVCLWLFLFVACLAVAIGFGYFGGSSGNGSLNIESEIETASAEGSTWSGSGTQANPYQIGTYADLLALSTACNMPTSGTTYNHYQDTHFKLMNNITLGADWVPIATNLDGTTTKYFSGIFDGAGHVISVNNTITFTTSGTGSEDKYYFGSLIGYLASGTVKNVTINFSLGNNSVFSVTKPSSVPNIFLGGVIGGCQSATISNCSISGSSITIDPESSSSPYMCSWFGGILGIGVSSTDVRTTTIDNCSLNVDVSLALCAGSGIVSNLVGDVTNCLVRSNFIMNNLGCMTVGRDIRYNLGGIAGKATVVSNCKFLGGNFKADYCNYSQRVGIIAGIATTVENCVVASYQNDAANFDITCGTAGMSGDTKVGLIAGEATTIANCSIDMTGTKLIASADDTVYAGVLAGEANAVSNCIARVSISNSNSGVFSLGRIKAICSSTSVNAYNCVVITSVSGVTTSYALTGASTSITNTANGLYSLTSTDSNLNELKSETTYTLGSAHFTWSSNTSYKWDFENTWIIKSTMNDGYPTLQMLITSCNITLSVTTNLSGSASSSTSGSTTGTSGAGTTSGATAAVDQFIIYRLDETGNVVNQFVVRNGSTVTFEVDKNKSFTIMINYKLYMVTTIGSESTNKKTFTPTADTTIDISITAPAGVNNWIVI